MPSNINTSKRMAPPKYVSGFTLMEILIALFIFSIISMIMVGALHNVMNASVETEGKAARLRSLQMALLILSRDVEQTVDRAVLSSKGTEDASFIGEAHSFTLTHTGFANPIFAAKRPTLQRVRYYLADDTLWRQTWDSLDLAPQATSHKRKLLDDLTNIDYEYLDNDGRMHDVWPFEKQNQQTLPRAIQVTITLANWGKMSQLYVITAEPNETQTGPPKS